jgi:F-type H+-transporting ATPase subunit b
MLRRSNPTRAVVLLTALLLAFAGCRLAAQEPHKAEERGPALEGHGDATAAPAGEPGAAEVAPNPLKVEPTLAIWTLVVFVGLFLLLGRFAWKPLLKALDERERHMQHVLEETERARNESESLLSEHRKQMSRAADEVRGVLEKARQDAQAAADQMIKLAQNEAEAARQRAQRDIATARDQALTEIWQKSAEIAVTVAAKVLSKQLSPDDHRRLLEAAIQELPAVAGANGHGGRPA